MSKHSLKSRRLKRPTERRSKGAAPNKRAASVAMAAVLSVLLTFSIMGASRMVSIPCGADIDEKINGDSGNIATRFELGACEYVASEKIVPKHGDEVAGPVGTFVQRGPAFDPAPLAVVRGAAGVENVFRPQGTVRLEWLRIEGGTGTRGQAGSGTGIAGGDMDDASVVYASEVTGSDAVGFSNAHGLVDRSEFFDTTRNPDFLGFTASGIKAVEEMHVRNSYFHENRGNAIWCDEECDDTSLGRFEATGNLVVDNGRFGIRWEKVPKRDPGGEALIEGNHVHGNGYDASGRAGVSVHDGANAVVRGNTFGQATVAGISYTYNANRLAIRISDSGHSDRPETENVTVENNQLNGETIKGRGLRP